MSEIEGDGGEDYSGAERLNRFSVHIRIEDKHVRLSGVRLSSESYIEARDRLVAKYILRARIRELERAAEAAGQALNESQALQNDISPPSTGQYIISMFAPLERQEEVLGDLAERFTLQTGRFGLRRAKVWYWWCVGRLVVTYTCRGAVGLLGLADLVDRFRSR